MYNKVYPFQLYNFMPCDNVINLCVHLMIMIEYPPSIIRPPHTHTNKFLESFLQYIPLPSLGFRNDWPASCHYRLICILCSWLCFWLLSLSMILRFIHIVVVICNLLLFVAKKCSFGRHNTFYSSIYMLTGIQVVFSFWLLWILLLWISMYMSLCGHMFSFILDKYLGIERLGHTGGP